MKNLSVALSVVVCFVAFRGMAGADSLLFVGFEDSSAFTVGGGGAQYWGIAPLTGPASIPSQFLQGSSSQSGMIFYGSFAKAYQGSPAATMTIGLPDLTGYANLRLTVALAAPEGIWEPTHRDSLRIIGGTTLLPPVVDCTGSNGCLPVPGEIDVFLPPNYPASLRSLVYSTDLHPEFQDFEYTINSSLKSITFAFASTDWPELVGIDSVRITGDPITTPVAIDIKPQSCPNPVNVKSRGALPVAILGTADLDVTTIDPVSIRLKGVAAIRSALEDVATPFGPPPNGEVDASNCTDLGPDGFVDLILKFDTEQVVAALGDVKDGDVLVPTLTGTLLDGTPIHGQDVVVILQKGKK